MNAAEHCARCEKLLGQPWPEVHAFLDQFFAQFPYEAHRIILHHALGVERVVALFGPEARKAAILHIRDDMAGLLDTPRDVWRRTVFVKDGDLDRINAILHELGLPGTGPRG